MKLVWDEVGKKFYETGVRMGVLYPMNSSGAYPKGVAWNGLSKVTESPSGAESNPVYADDQQYLNMLSAEKFGATIEAYTYPDEFAICDGSVEIAPGVRAGQQPRKTFGLCYRTTLGNDVNSNDYGYKLHLIYGALAAPSEKDYETVNDSPDAIAFSWELSTTPVSVPGGKPTAILTIDSATIDPAKLKTLEDVLYGTDGADPRLPLPDEVASLISGDVPSALALSSIVPDDTTTAAVDANIVLTFNNKILRESVVVMSAAGVKIDGVKTWDTTGKILTFNPVSNFASTTVYLVAITGVIDSYGQSLDPVIKNFTTV